MDKRLRFALSIIIVLATIAEFTYYLSRHSYLLKQLGHTSPLIIVWLLLLYVAILGALALILIASLRICRIKVTMPENFLLNAYSLLVNFFIIGQVGPGVRAAYLKKKYKLLIKNFIFVTLAYYACYAVISVLLILLGSKAAWWLSGLFIVLVGVASVAIVQIYAKRNNIQEGKLNWSPSNVGFLFAATLLQSVIQLAIYSIELHSVNGHVALRQTIAYTGVANLALFVALTPGAIGIRESFLIFSEKLHHISSANIVSANIIDRAVYIIFLGALFLVVLSFHATKKLGVKS